MLEGKKIIVGISGGISAYKSVYLIRLLKKKGAEVKVVTTKNALKFVTKLTLETISQNTVYSDVFENVSEYNTEHISLAEWGDVFIIAPATANIIGKYVSGIADDALSTSLLAFNKQLFFAPAMNSEMYYNPIVQHNLKKLLEYGVTIIEPTTGFLACNKEGKGRMEEPEVIVEIIENYFNNKNCFSGYKVLVTAGPTYEKIDPVRFIGNFSSGKMGFEIANYFAECGADVILVTGPVSLKHKNFSNIKRIDVTTAEEMFDECMKFFPGSNITIMAAAVADFKPAEYSQQKIKSAKNTPLSIKLVPNPDILKELGKLKKNDQILIGFALESENEIVNARRKLVEKNLDFIIVNSLNDEGAGFGHDTNKITILTENTQIEYPLMTKRDVARNIVQYIYDNLIKNKLKE